MSVKSTLDRERDSTVFHDIKGPVALPGRRTWKGWMSGGLGGAAVLLAVVIWGLHRSGRKAPEVAVPAHEWASKQLQLLHDERLIDRGRVREFYFRLSMIARQYVERRFDLRAAEQTTEEFAADVQCSRRLPPEYRAALADFLRACDVVKFARHVPPADESERVFDSVRDLVRQSAESKPRGAQAA